jgi:hypothetical protein
LGVTYEIIVAGFRAGILGRREFGRRFRYALDGGDVGFLFGGGDVSPWSVSVSFSTEDGVAEKIGGNIPFPTYTKLILCASRRLCNRSIDSSSALRLQIADCISSAEDIQ